MPGQAMAPRSPDDAHAIVAYLRSIPPVKNATPNLFGSKEVLEDAWAAENKPDRSAFGVKGALADPTAFRKGGCDSGPCRPTAPQKKRPDPTNPPEACQSDRASLG